MNHAPNTARPTLQSESPASYHSNGLGGASTEGSSPLRLEHLAGGPSSDFGTIDPLDIQRPLPETWCSMPQTSLQPEVHHPANAFMSNSAMAGNYGSAASDGMLEPGRSIIPSEPYSMDPRVPSAQDGVRVFPCLFIQHRSGHITAGPGPGHLEFVFSNAQLDRWIDYANAWRASPQVTRSGNGGLPNHDAPPATTQSSISGWYPGMLSLPQPTHTGPQTPMSATPTSVWIPPSPQFNQDPVPRSSYSGPSDSRCAPAVTSIPSAPHYYDNPPSLNSPPPPISYTANLDPSRSAVHPLAFYQGSAPMDGRVPICFGSLAQLPADNGTQPVGVPQLISSTQGTGAAPGYPVRSDLPPEARAHRQLGGHGRTPRGLHGRGRSG